MVHCYRKWGSIPPPLTHYVMLLPEGGALHRVFSLPRRIISSTRAPRTKISGRFSATWQVLQAMCRRKGWINHIGGVPKMYCFALVILLTVKIPVVSTLVSGGGGTSRNPCTALFRGNVTMTRDQNSREKMKQTCFALEHTKRQTRLPRIEGAPSPRCHADEPTPPKYE